MNTGSVECGEFLDHLNVC